MNTSIQPYVKSIEIVYEDDYLIAVNKPNNFIVHESHYARNIKEITLLDFLYQQLGYHVYPIHRLDRKTSGILVLLKNKEFVAQFQALFTSNSINKTYYAIVRGFSKDSDSIDSPVKNDDTGVYKDALTKYETIQQFETEIPVHPYNTSRYSLVKLTPETGRMHQLRIHLNKIISFMFLHAYSLEFIHPITNKKLVLSANFPNDWDKIFKKFNWNSI